MSTGRSFWIGVVLAVAVSAGGCKNKDAEQAPTLATPERVFLGVGQSGDRENLSAEAEVKTSSGPVELTLRVYRKRVSRGMDSLWAQVVLRNVGKDKIFVTDEAFSKPGHLAVGRKFGVYLEFVDARGESLDGCPSLTSGPLGCGTISDDDDHDPALPYVPKGSTPAQRKRIEDAYYAWGENIRKREALRDELERRGVPRDEYHRRIAEFEKAHGLEEPIRLPKSFWLPPASSTTTPAWAECEAYHPALPQKLLVDGKPIGQFSEVLVACLEPGKYRIRAVYNFPQRFWGKDIHSPPPEWYVLLKTPPIEIEVLP
jgi:hypothetical protein